MKNTCQTYDRHMSHVCDHHKWSPGKILTCLHVRHLDVAQSGQKLTGTVLKCKITCRTRDRHVSHVWDHHHWIPGKILTCLHVRHLDVAHLEPKIKIFINVEQNFYSWAHFGNFGPRGLTKNLRPLLYTNMTPTKTPIASEPLNLAFFHQADRLG